MQRIISILIAILIFSILVIFHEFGHFIVAKKSGIKVLEFSVGMGPRIFSKQKGETLYSIKALPLGGSCMMYGEDEDEEKLDSEKDRAFGSKSVWARIAVVAAGPVFNFILAFVVAIGLVIAGGVAKPYVVDVEKDSPTYEAGIRNGDVVLRYDGAKIFTSDDVMLRQYTTTTKQSENIKVVYKRKGKKHTATIKPKEKQRILLGISYSPTDLPVTALEPVLEDGAFAKAGGKAGDTILSIDGVEMKNGKEFAKYTSNHPFTEGKKLSIVIKRGNKKKTIEVAPKMMTVYETGFDVNGIRKKVGPLGCVKYGYATFRYNINMVVQSLKLIFTGSVKKEEVSGPIGIVGAIGDTYEQSLIQGIKVVIMNLASLLVMLSANLGVMNLLPIPALDGGRLVFLFFEAVRGKPVDREKEGFVHLVGFALLMVLMVFTFYNDISKIIAGM